jgi:hypothetical protein
MTAEVPVSHEVARHKIRLALARRAGSAPARRSMTLDEVDLVLTELGFGPLLTELDR